MNPNFADAHIAVGIILDRQYRPYEAINSFKTALSLSPHHSYAQGNLAAALTHCGQIDEAIEAAGGDPLNPGSPAYNAAVTMHYSSKVTPQLFDEHVEFNRRFGAGIGVDQAAATMRPRSGAPHRLSPAISSGTVSKFILPVMQNHDRSVQIPLFETKSPTT
jgi:hypothetical protein